VNGALNGKEHFMNMEIFIPITFFLLTAYVIVKILDHRQRMRMIEKGISKLEFSEPPRDRSVTSIKYGLVTIALGLAIFMAQMFEKFVGTPFDAEIGLALVPIFVGVALILSAILEKRAEKQHGLAARE
jgi:hypothetical protein